MTREQLENEIALFNHLLADPHPDPCAVEDAYTRLAVALLQWMDYAAGLVRTADHYRHGCERLAAENERLRWQLEKAREGNRRLLRAMAHAGGVAPTGEWPSADWCKRRCLEVG